MKVQRTHFSITQAGLISLATGVVTLLVALIPSWKPHAQTLITDIGAVIAAAFPLANAVHALIAAKATPADIEQGVGRLVQAEVGKIDIAKLVQAAVKGDAINLEALVQDELNKLVGAKLAESAATKSGPVGVVPPPQV